MNVASYHNRHLTTKHNPCHNRFSRDIGPSLGINLAEFEFPCYFNFFIRGKDCTLVVDDERAEENIKR